MKELYQEKDFHDLLRARKKYLSLGVIALALGLASSLLLLLVLNRNNKPWLFWIQTLLFAIGFSFALVFFLGRVSPISHREELVDVALHNPRQTEEVKIQNLGKTLTVSSSLEAQEIEVSLQETKKTLYWDVSLGETPLEVGKTYRLILADNWIVGMEALHE